MVKRVEYMMPAVHEKMITPAAFLVNAIKIIPVQKKLSIKNLENSNFVTKKHTTSINQLSTHVNRSCPKKSDQIKFARNRTKKNYK